MIKPVAIGPVKGLETTPTRVNPKHLDAPVNVSLESAPISAEPLDSYTCNLESETSWRILGRCKPTGGFTMTLILVLSSIVLLDVLVSLVKQFLVSVEFVLEERAAKLFPHTSFALAGALSAAKPQPPRLPLTGKRVGHISSRG